MYSRAVAMAGWMQWIDGMLR